MNLKISTFKISLQENYGYRCYQKENSNIVKFALPHL
jgi:hypothetical protein